MERLNLFEGEIIKNGRVASGQVGKDRSYRYTTLRLQAIAYGLHVFGLKPEAMHSRVDFKMYGIGGDSPAFGFADHRFQQPETVNFRFKLILEQGIETAEFRIHDDDGDGYARAPQIGSFVGHRHGQVIATMFLQCFGKFE